MGQQTGNFGVLELERRLRNVDKEPFTRAEAANHEARLRALSGAGGTKAAGDAARVFFAEQMAKLRGYAEQLDRAYHTIGSRVAEQLGGSQEEVSAQELDEAHQAALEALRKPVRAAASALQEAVDPDGTLALRGDWVADEAKRLVKEVNPRMGGGLADAERAPLEAAAAMRPVELFSDLRELDGNLAAAQRAIKNDPKLGAESKPFRRVTALREAIDAAMADAAGAAAERDAKLAAAAYIDLNGTAGAKFAAEFQNVTGRTGARAGDNAADAGTSAGGPMAVDRGGNRDASQEEAGRQSAGTNRRVAPAPAVIRPVGRATKPQSLLSFLVARGGIRDEGGGLAAMGLNSRTRPTLIRSGGMHLDTAREVAIEAGYLPADNPNSPNRSDIPMLLDHIAEEASGRKVYRPGDGAALAIDADEAKVLRAHEERVSRARDAVSGTLEDMGERLSRDGMVHASHPVADMGLHPQQAVQDALTAEHHATQELETRRMDMGPQAGIPGAVQEVLPIEATSRLKPNFGAGDRQALRAANRAYADYKNTYRRGVVGDILAHGDLPTGFKMPGGEVPRAIFRSDANGTSAIDAFIKAAGSPEKAVEILGDYPAMVFRRFAEKDGVIDPGRATKWLADNHDVLRKLPGMAEKFSNAAAATKLLQEASACGQSVLKAYQDGAAKHYLTKDGEPVEPQAAMANLLKSPTAPEDACQLLRLVGTNEAALDGIRRSYVDHIVQRTRSAIEAGTSGTKEIQSRAFQNLAADPKTMTVSRIILGNDGADLMQKIAKDIKLANRTANGTRIPGSPGTAADLHAQAMEGHGNPSILSQVVLGEMSGEAAAGVLHAGGPAGTMLRVGVAVGNMVLNAARLAGLKKVEDLAAYAVLHPEIGRMLVTQVRVSPQTPILKTLAARIGAIGTGTLAGVHGEARP